MFTPQTGSVPHLFVKEFYRENFFLIQILLREVSAIRDWMVCGLLILASMCDLWSHRIDNRIIFFGWIFGIIISCYEYGIMGAGCFICNALVVLVTLFILYCIKCIGSGDAKLLSVIGGMYGYALAGYVIFYAFIIVAAGTVFYILWNCIVCGREYIWRNQGKYRTHKIPMAVPISLGYFIMLAGVRLPV